jgi:hypothetical protein
VDDDNFGQLCGSDCVNDLWTQLWQLCQRPLVVLQSSGAYAHCAFSRSGVIVHRLTTAVRSQTFLPLTRTGLHLVLQLCTFYVDEIDVIEAVEHWTLRSSWVQSTYGGATMKQGHVNALMMFVDPTCLSPAEFSRVDKLFFLQVQARYPLPGLLSVLVSWIVCLTYARDGLPRLRSGRPWVPAGAGPLLEALPPRSRCHAAAAHRPKFTL